MLSGLLDGDAHLRGMTIRMTGYYQPSRGVRGEWRRHMFAS